PKNSIIKQYKKLMEMDGITFKIESDVYQYIVEQAIEFKLGARGLRTIVEAIMIDAMYDLPSEEKKEFVLTLNYAKKQMENTNFSKFREV
ncbi:MAG: ATP-dependent Clp protease ATP-binding subunit ClpX, partial [Bacteroidaceae bacterium]